VQILSIFAAFATALAVPGAYAPIAHAVSLPNRVIGIRVALGASPVEAVMLFLRQGAAAAGAGILVGLGAAKAPPSSAGHDAQGGVDTDKEADETAVEWTAVSNAAEPRQRAVVLEVSDLKKSHGERAAVREVSFSIRAGEIFGLLGPNGAGKTTTIGMIASTVVPTGGEVRVLGRSATSQRSATKKHLGLVPQRICLYPPLTAEENLLFFGRMYGLGQSHLAERVEALLQLAGLTDRRHDRVSTFSGGMQRRLNLACGLVHEPQLLLLDEPTVGIDPQSRERIFTAVEKLAASGMAVLYTTHYMEEAERLCHQIAIMDEGRFVAEGSVTELAGLVGERVTKVAVVPRSNLGEVFFHLTGKELRD
jgi:ABC-2 type transport system ATP-binding protein